MQTEYELIHHGILGMKWGVRRYQPYGEGGYNPKHKGTNKISKKQQRYEAKKAKTRADRERDSRDRDLLSDKALNEKVKRLQTEKRLKELTEESLHPGKAKVKKILAGTAGTVATGAATYAGYLLLQKALGTKVTLKKPTGLALTPQGLKKVGPKLPKIQSIQIGKATPMNLEEKAKFLMKGGKFKK